MKKLNILDINLLVNQLNKKHDKSTYLDDSICELRRYENRKQVNLKSWTGYSGRLVKRDNDLIIESLGQVVGYYNEYKGKFVMCDHLDHEYNTDMVNSLFKKDLNLNTQIMYNLAKENGGEYIMNRPTHCKVKVMNYDKEVRIQFIHFDKVVLDIMREPDIFLEVRHLIGGPHHLNNHKAS